MSEHVLQSIDDIDTDHVPTETSSEDAAAELQSETSETVAQEIAETTDNEVEAVSNETADALTDSEGELAAESMDDVTEGTDKNSTDEIEPVLVDDSEELSDKVFQEMIQQVIEELKNKGLVSSSEDETTTPDAKPEDNPPENKTDPPPEEEDDPNLPCGGSDSLESLDWYLLEAGLILELGDAKLTAKEKDELPDSAFCGPNRSFPIPDCAHVASARRLINRTKLSTSQKDEILASVNKKANNLSCSSEDMSTEYEALKEDHLLVLKKIENLESAFNSSIDYLAKNLGEDIASCEDLTSKITWLESLTGSTKQKSVVNIENPSVASTGAIIDSPKKNFGDYEKVVIDNYNNILLTNGTDAAESFLTSKRRYLPRGFHPNNFIGD